MRMVRTMRCLAFAMGCASSLVAAWAGETVPAEPVVAVIDFRSCELSPDFQKRFESTLAAAVAGSGLRPRVKLARTRLRIADFEAHVRELEKHAPAIYYATTADIARSVRQVNPGVPIVFSGIVDPRGRLVRSVDRPEGNMTGFVSYEDVDRKRIEILADLFPHVKRLGVIVEDEEQARAGYARLASANAGSALALVPLFFPEGGDVRTLPGLIARHRLDALDAPTSVLVRTHHEAIIRAAREARIPVSFRGAGFVERGGTLSYEPREFDYPVKAARMIARILQGASPGDMPIEFPSEFVLTVNAPALRALPHGMNKTVLTRVNTVFHSALPPPVTRPEPEEADCSRRGSSS